MTVVQKEMSAISVPAIVGPVKQQVEGLGLGGLGVAMALEPQATPGRSWSSSLLGLPLRFPGSWLHCDLGPTLASLHQPQAASSTPWLPW